MKQDRQSSELREEYVDPRVDLCLWFFQPGYVSGIEIQAFVELRSTIPVIPVIAKVN